MIRDIVGLLRGKATPLQVFLACLLGALIGFVPSFSTSGGLLVAYVLLLLVLNANIGLCLLVAGFAKLLALLAMPVSFSIGRVLLEGPSEGLFRSAVNAPVLAWFGLEYYATTGGLVLGLVTGLVVGGFLSKTLSAFRTRMAKVEEKSEKFTKVSTTWWSRSLLWVLVGSGHGKKTYSDVASQKHSSPIRLAGVVVVVVLLGVLFLAPTLMSGPFLGGAAKSGLETWNGATVDVDAVDLDLAAGTLSVSGLAMADPNALGTDLFRALSLEADLGTEDLLRRKLSIDRLVIVDGATGARRTSPGSLVGPAPEPDLGPTAEEVAQGDSKSLEDYLADAELWKNRLAQVREWLDTLSSGEGVEQETEESFEERLAREVAAKGYAAVSARHLLTDAPTLLIREIIAGGVRSEQMPGELLDIRLANVSTQPSLVDQPARMSIVAQSGRLDVDVGLGGASAEPADNTLKFILKGVASETVAGSLQVDGKPALSKGTLDFSLNGTWIGGRVGELDLPLDVTLHGVTVALPSGARKLDGLTLPFGLRGPLDNPRISFDDDAMADALLAGVKAELTAEVDKKKAELEAKKDEKLDEVKDELDDKIGDALGGLFGDDKDDEEKKKKKAKKKAAKAAAEAEAAAEDGTEDDG